MGQYAKAVDTLKGADQKNPWSMRIWYWHMPNWVVSERRELRQWRMRISPDSLAETYRRNPRYRSEPRGTGIGRRVAE
jgi:hypothetical protein